MKKKIVVLGSTGSIGKITLNLFKKDRKNLWTFASYEQGDELFSDRNVYPLGCIMKMEKINL